MNLFPNTKQYPDLQNIDLRCCDVAEILEEAKWATLVMADPPWVYECSAIPRGDGSMAELPYSLLTMEQIGQHVNRAHHCVENGYFLCWCTWPKLHHWLSIPIDWTYKSGGCWTKTGGIGVGHHWRGDCEPLLMYTKGKPKPRRTVRNAFSSERQAHSEKPTEWLVELVRAFSDPGDLVLDLYAGLAPMARACHITGRRYIGAEIDPERHQAAMGKLWQSTSSGVQCTPGG